MDEFITYAGTIKKATKLEANAGNVLNTTVAVIR